MKYPMLLIAAVVLLSSIGTYSYAVNSENEIIPAWIKNVAEFWVNDEIPDSEFIAALEFMIENGIIKIENMDPAITKEPSVMSESTKTEDNELVNNLKKSMLAVGKIIEANDGYGELGADEKITLEEFFTIQESLYDIVLTECERIESKNDYDGWEQKAKNMSLEEESRGKIIEYNKIIYDNGYLGEDYKYDDIMIMGENTDRLSSKANEYFSEFMKCMFDKTLKYGSQTTEGSTFFSSSSKTELDELDTEQARLMVLVTSIMDQSYEISQNDEIIIKRFIAILGDRVDILLTECERIESKNDYELFTIEAGKALGWTNRNEWKIKNLAYNDKLYDYDFGGDAEMPFTEARLDVVNKEFLYTDCLKEKSVQFYIE